MDINLQTLSTTPSDHECKDGDLCAMLNVINEDGALHIIPEPTVKATVANSVYDLADTKFHIHKVDNDDPEKDDHTNWIAVVSGTEGNRILWCDDINADKQVWTKIAALNGFAVNAVTFTGRIVSLVGSKETRWLMWDGEEYRPYAKDDFGFQVRITSEMASYDTYKANFDDIVMENYVDENGIPLTDNDKSSQIRGISKTGMDYFLERLDAQVSSVVEGGNNLHKYKSFGFCALRMYDGSYVRVSDIFYIGPKGTTAAMHYSDIKSSDRYVSFATGLHRHKIAVALPELERVKNLMLGIDVFLCAPGLFYKTSQVHMFARSAWGDTRATNVQFQPYSTAEIYDEVDKLSFHRVMRIEKKDICATIAGAEKNAQYIPPFDETGSTLTLEDFGAAAYGATVAHNYNGRLNIGDVCRTVSFNPMAGTGGGAGIDYRWDDSYLDTGTDTSCGGIMWNGQCFPLYSKSLSPKRFAETVAYFSIRYTDGNSNRTVYAMSQTAVPLPPIVMLPYPNIESVDIYLGDVGTGSDWPDDYKNKYWRKTNIEFHTSATGNWSYVVTMKGYNIILKSPSLLSPVRYTGLEPALTGDFEEITTEEYVAAARAYIDGTQELCVRNRNSIFVSESGNPFVTKATTQVTVGDGTVLALQAPTQPISQGQAGSTPLVAFTSEGIYPLYVSATGLYSATQPGPRDVIIKGDAGYNTEAVVSIDNAILFPTDRGLMMYAGSGTSCLTETLRGKVHDVELPHLAEIFTDCGQGTPTEDNIAAYTLEGGLREYMKTCRTVYDYASQKVYLYQPDGDAALVYSMRSGAWGMAECSLRQSLNSYPDALAVDQKGRIVDMYNGEPGERDFFAITRPIGFGAPHTLKRVGQQIMRGLFRQGKVKCAVWGSRDLQNWFLLNSSQKHFLKGRFGAPYKYFRYAVLGTLAEGETVEGVSAEVTESLTNKLR